MKRKMLNRSNIFAVLMFLILLGCFQNTVVNAAKSKECVISNGVLKSYSGNRTVYKIPKNVKKIEFGAFEKASNFVCQKS